MKTKTLKAMTAAEISSERSRHRNQIGFLVLAKMRDDKSPAEIIEIGAKLVKHRRRVVRLDRRFAELKAIANRPVSPSDFEWRDLPILPA